MSSHTRSTGEEAQGHCADILITCPLVRTLITWICNLAPTTLIEFNAPSDKIYRFALSLPEWCRSKETHPDKAMMIALSCPHSHLVIDTEDNLWVGAGGDLNSNSRNALIKCVFLCHVQWSVPTQQTSIGSRRVYLLGRYTDHPPTNNPGSLSV